MLRGDGVYELLPTTLLKLTSEAKICLLISEAFQKTNKTFGTLDIVVNNAGIFNDVEWEKEVDIKLVCHRYLYCTHSLRRSQTTGKQTN